MPIHIKRKLLQYRLVNLFRDVMVVMTSQRNQKQLPQNEADGVYRRLLPFPALVLTIQFLYEHSEANVRACRIKDDLPILALVLISGQRDHVTNVELLGCPGFCSPSAPTVTPLSCLRPSEPFRVLDQ
jgi:hypothetical protein